VVDRVTFNRVVNIELEVDIPLIAAEGEYQGQRHLGPPYENAPRQPQTATLGRTSCLHDEAGEAQSQAERDQIQIAEFDTHRCQYKCHYRSHQQHLGYSPFLGHTLSFYASDRTGSRLNSEFDPSQQYAQLNTVAFPDTTVTQNSGG